VGCFLFLPGRARGPTARRPTPTHTICYSALVGGGRRPFGPHLAAAEVSQTLSAEHVGRGGCPKWVVLCSSQAGRVVQPRGVQRQPTLFAIPRWLAGGAAHLDHTLPPRRSPTPCLLNTLGAEVVQIGLFFVPPRPGAWSNHAAPHANPGVVESGLFCVPPRPGAWSNHAAPHANPHYLPLRVGWRGAPPIWTTPCRRGGLPHPVC
jgi:hypothetical protein